MALNTVSSDRLSTNVKNTNFTSAEKQDLTDDIKPLLGSSGGGVKNLIINGAMEVAQRGTSSTTAGYQTVDRFQSYFANTGVTITQSQQSLTSSDTPYTSGFRKFYRTALGSAGTANANAEVGIFQRLEAQDIASSGWNYISSSSNITLQFWFRCSTNQTFYCYLESQDGTGQSYPFSFTATGNNTWTKITNTFPGNSNLQFDSDANYGLQLAIIPFFGTDLTNNKTLDQWSAFSASNRLPDMASTWLTAGASTFDLTGVQLEVGSVATDFEHRSFGQELALCQRYFFSITGDNADYPGCYTGGMARGGHFFWMCHFPVAMRTNPTYTGVSGNGQAYGDGDSNTFANSAAILQGETTTPNPRGMGMRATSPGGSMSNGNGYMYRFSGDTNVLQFSAEL